MVNMSQKNIFKKLMDKIKGKKSIIVSHTYPREFMIAYINRYGSHWSPNNHGKTLRIVKSNGSKEYPFDEVLLAIKAFKLPWFDETMQFKRVQITGEPEVIFYE